LSSASTAATESSKSTIVVTAASASTSWTPAGSVAADRRGPVNDDLEVQPVVAQQHARRRGALADVAGERGPGSASPAGPAGVSATRPSAVTE